MLIIDQYVATSDGTKDIYYCYDDLSEDEKEQLEEEIGAYVSVDELEEKPVIINSSYYPDFDYYTVEDALAIIGDTPESWTENGVI